jgi:hypothetical protein
MLTGCKKKRVTLAPSSSAPVQYDVAAAEKLGFVSYLPQDTEACIALTHWSSHLLALSRTEVYQEWKKERGLNGAIKAQKIEPAFSPTAQEEDSVYSRLHGRDTLLAVGSGGHIALASIQPLWRLHLEMLTAEYASQWLRGKSWKSFMELETNAIERLAKNEVKRDEWLRLLAECQLPPLVLSVKTPDGEGLFQLLFPQELRQQWLRYAKVGQVSGKYHFQFVEGGLGKICPEVWLPYLKLFFKSKSKDSKALWYATLEALSKKRLCVSFGQVGDHAVVMLGTQRPSFHFPEPGHSLLQVPELAAAATSGEDLIAHGYCNQQLRNTLKIRESVPAIISGLLGSAEAQSVLHDIAPSWVTMGEEWLRTQSATASSLGFTLNSEKGLMLRTRSRQDGAEIPPPSPFTNLIHGSHTAAVWSGRHTAAESKFFNQLLSVLSKTVLQGSRRWLAHQGTNEREKKNFAMLERQLLPSVEKLANSVQALNQKAFGQEHAFILDWQNAGPSPWPEVAGVWSVQDRQTVSTTWRSMDTAAQEIFAAFSTAPGIMLP